MYVTTARSRQIRKSSESRQAETWAYVPARGPSLPFHNFPPLVSFQYLRFVDKFQKSSMHSPYS